MNRRRFLRRAGAAAALLVPGACAVPEAARFSGRRVLPACDARAPLPPPEGHERWNRVLVLVELNGGNDGLNTVVPYSDLAYHRLRPTLALARDQVIQLDERFGFNAVLEPLMPLWQRCRMAVALGVGYPEPNLSHFRSIDIWDTASDTRQVLRQGWLARLFTEDRPPRDFAADGVLLGRDQLGPLAGEGMRVVVLNNPKLLTVANRMREPAAKAPNAALAHLAATQDSARHASRVILDKRLDAVALNTPFPEDAFGRQMETAARLVVSRSPIPVIKASVGNFDTHAKQPDEHRDLLASLAKGLAAFAAALEASGDWDRVLVMTYSEFGRRPAENTSAGTDHGTSAPQFLVGGRVRGGFYGAQPPLDRLVERNLEHRLHFRSLYATAAREWWGLKASFLAEKPLGCIV